MRKSEGCGKEDKPWGDADEGEGGSSGKDVMISNSAGQPESSIAEPKRNSVKTRIKSVLTFGLN